MKSYDELQKDAKHSYLVYKLSVPKQSPAKAPVASIIVVKPTLANIIRFSKGYKLFPIWWVFSQAKLFYNDYFALVLLLENGQVVHRTCVFPGFYKFPFMKKEDLQLGDIWTRADFKNQGIASRVIKHILSIQEFAGRTFWYLTEPTNLASIRLAEKSGFILFSVADKKKKLGLSFIGHYDIMGSAVNIKFTVGP